MQDELPLDNEDIEQILNTAVFNEVVIENIIDEVTVPKVSYDLAKVLYIKSWNLKYLILYLKKCGLYWGNKKELNCILI